MCSGSGPASAKVIAYTDESGRYSLDLIPGVWDITIEMFGFTPLHEQVTIGPAPLYKNWTLVVPRINGAVQTGNADLVNPTAGRRGGRGLSFHVLQRPESSG